MVADHGELWQVLGAHLTRYQARLGSGNYRLAKLSSADLTKRSFTLYVNDTNWLRK